MKTTSRQRRLTAEAIPSGIYDRAYFLSTTLEGYEEFLEDGISSVKQRELAVLDSRKGHRVLDLGCGRGEVVAELARRGARPVGLDYAWDAVALTRETTRGMVPGVQGDAGALPFPDGSFDRVLLGDVIEHLPWPLGVQALREVARILRPGGRALIHTSPNTWFIKVVLPPLRLALKAMGQGEVLQRFSEYERLQPLMHPNELNPHSLKRLMRAAGLPATTWVDRDVLRRGQSEWTSELVERRLVRLIGRVAGSWPLKFIMANDMYALVERPGPIDDRPGQTDIDLRESEAERSEVGGTPDHASWRSDSHAAIGDLAVDDTVRSDGAATANP